MAWSATPIRLATKSVSSGIVSRIEHDVNWKQSILFFYAKESDDTEWCSSKKRLGLMDLRNRHCHYVDLSDLGLLATHLLKYLDTL